MFQFTNQQTTANEKNAWVNDFQVRMCSMECSTSCAVQPKQQDLMTSLFAVNPFWFFFYQKCLHFDEIYKHKYERMCPPPDRVDVNTKQHLCQRK